MRAERSGFRARLLAGALLAFASTGIALAHVRVTAQPEVPAAADAYATLTFPLSGEGRYRFEIVPPDGWTAVTRQGEVDLRGDGFVSVTVRVPTLAPVGERFATELRLLDGERLVVTARGHVTVTRRIRISLLGPDDLLGRPGEPLSFEVVLGNEGNARDTLTLSARHSHWDVRIDGSETPLEPGERRIVKVTLHPTTTVNSGYRHIFYLVAASIDDPDVEVVAEVTSHFYARDPAAGQRASGRPQLTLNVSAGAAAGVTASAGEVSANAGYWVMPELAGQLSDYVDGELRTSKLAGTVSDPFAEVPSSLAMSLEGPGWDGSLDVSPQRYALGVGVDLERWRVSAAGAVTPGRGVGASARLERGDGALQVAARTGLLGRRRTDALVASYRTDLANDLALTVGAGVSGFAGMAESGGYQVAFTVSQRLAWHDDRFDVNQSYAGVPFAGVHTIGLSGGTRSLYPIGVRVQTAYSLSPVSDRWNSGVTLFGSPARGLTMDVTLGLSVEGAGVRSGVTWSVSPRVGYTVRSPAGLIASFTVRYGHGGVAAGSGTAWDRYEAGLRLDHRDLGLTATAEYEVRRGDGVPTPDTSFQATVQPTYAIGSDALLFASYAYEDRTSPIPRVRHEIGLGWLHTWNPTIASRLEYQRTFDMLGDADRERVGVSLNVKDVMTAGLDLDARYAITSPTSLLDFATPQSHDLTVGFGYAIPLVFDTPDVLIDLFGGRRGGEVHGLVFVDANRNGEFEASEDRPLAGLEIQIGSERTTADAEGRYRLRVPEGTYEVSFPVGLPATIDLCGERTVHVVDNERHQVLLPFAPVVSLAVELFDDLDHDGIRGTSEGGIAFGGVVLDGPQRRVVRTDATGKAIVSGLVTGTYVVTVSSAHLPSGYRPTTEPLRVTFEAHDRPPPVLLGAARQARSVVRTFSAGSLAVLPRALQTTVAPGAEIELEALVQGVADRVLVEYGGVEAAFMPSASSWRLRIRIPRGTPLGLLELSVRATRGDQSVERPLFVNVVDRAPYTASSVVAAAGKNVEVEVTTHFEAQEAQLLMPDGGRVMLASADGYLWTATWRAPLTVGRLLAELRVDGEVLGDIAISVFAPPDTQGDASRGVRSSLHGEAPVQDQTDGGGVTVPVDPRDGERGVFL